MPAPAWRIVSAPINGALRLVFIGSLPQQMRDVCRLEWTPKQQRRFDRFAAFMRTANLVINRLPCGCCTPHGAYDGWSARASTPQTPQRIGSAFRQSSIDRRGVTKP